MLWMTTSELPSVLLDARKLAVSSGGAGSPAAGKPDSSAPQLPGSDVGVLLTC